MPEHMIPFTFHRSRGRSGPPRSFAFRRPFTRRKSTRGFRSSFFISGLLSVLPMFSNCSLILSMMEVIP